MRVCTQMALHIAQLQSRLENRTLIKVEASDLSVHVAWYLLAATCVTVNYHPFYSHPIQFLS